MTDSNAVFEFVSVCHIKMGGRMSSLNNLNESIGSNAQALNQLESQVGESSTKVKKNFSTLKGEFVTWLTGKQGKMPKWAAKHIEIHKQLQKAVDEMKAMGEGDKIPPDVVQALKESKQVIGVIANKVNYSAFLQAILPNIDAISQPEGGKALYSDPTGLLKPLKPDTAKSHSNMKEWELNFGLLYSAYQRTNNKETKATIRFLMTNYLQKAAYLNSNTQINMSEEDTQSYQNMLQMGQMTMGGMYHRTADTTAPMLRILNLESKIGSREEKSRDLIPTDTTEVQGLYNVGFVTTPDISKSDEIVDILVEQFEAHLHQFPNENMGFPVLIDITAQIGQSLVTDGDSEKIAVYQDKQQKAKVQINEILQQAAEKIKKKYPDRDDIQSKAHDYIKTNTVIVSRAQLTDRVAVIGLHQNVFDENDFEQVRENEFEHGPDGKRKELIEEKVKSWAGHSGVGVGAVNFRRVIADSYTDPVALANLGVGRAVNYAVPGDADAIMYGKPITVLESNVFKMLTKMGEGESKNVGEAQVLLAKATAEMMKTLLNNISDEDWDEKQKDPIIRELTQNAVYRTAQHLAAGINNASDFRQFSQAIDRTHAELTTLLVLYSPFKISSFETKYREFIQPLFPKSMKPTQVGVARSAMNVFAGVNAAVIQNNHDPVRICGAHSYYEESILVGGSLTLEEALEDPQIEKVDMYVAEFYHNIDIDPKHTNYQKGTVIQDIKSIFGKKPQTDSLTVAIDATIDLANSEDIKELLKEFEAEIKDGKLNIVVFRSGQKFDMMGLDNYYGSPFYMVNNGDEKWDEFNKIKTDEVFQTDELSQQFFSWMAETGPDIVDQYKKQIFDNTRNILEMVPDQLKPIEGREVCICNFEKGVKTPFIDIKINLEGQRKEELHRWAQHRFMQLFTSEDKLVYVRGSFGFPCPNITWIDPKMRINPGIDPSDNSLFKQFFEELAIKAKEIENAEEIGP